MGKLSANIAYAVVAKVKRSIVDGVSDVLDDFEKRVTRDASEVNDRFGNLTAKVDELTASVSTLLDAFGELVEEVKVAPPNFDGEANVDFDGDLIVLDDVEVDDDDADANYECPVCGKRYKSERWFKNHLNKKHDVEVQ